MHCQTDNVFFLISQPSNIEAKPQLTPEQQRRTQLASALFTGLSGPSKSIKMKPKAQAKGERVKRDGHPQPSTGGEGLLLDLHVSCEILHK